MTWWQAILLGALQGLTEFLPVSSSGHLVLAQHYLGFAGESAGKGASLFFDGMLHLGTLAAVLWYFRRGLRDPTFLTAEPSASPPSALDLNSPPAGVFWLRLMALVVLGSAPAALAALTFGEHIKESFASPSLVATCLIALGVVLLATDRLPPGKDGFSSTCWWQALLVGCGQAVSAVARGMSRSGMTIAAALAVGLSRDWAVRYSFLLSIVANLGLAGLGVYKAIDDPSHPAWLTAEFLLMTGVGTAVSAVVGYLTITPLLLLVRRARLWWFAVYVMALGTVVLLGL